MPVTRPGSATAESGSADGRGEPLQLVSRARVYDEPPRAPRISFGGDSGFGAAGYDPDVLGDVGGHLHLRSRRNP